MFALVIDDKHTHYHSIHTKWNRVREQSKAVFSLPPNFTVHSSIYLSISRTNETFFLFSYILTSGQYTHISSTFNTNFTHDYFLSISFYAKKNFFRLSLTLTRLLFCFCHVFHIGHLFSVGKIRTITKG